MGCSQPFKGAAEPDIAAVLQIAVQRVQAGRDRLERLAPQGEASRYVQRGYARMLEALLLAQALHDDIALTLGAAEAEPRGNVVLLAPPHSGAAASLAGHS